MTELVYQPKGLYFEDFEVGVKLRTAGRTITEADIVAFAGLSGDFNQIHTNAEYAAADTFGRRVAHGLLVQSIATGLAVQSGVIEGTVLAFRELDAKFSLPVFIGDTELGCSGAERRSGPVGSSSSWRSFLSCISPT